MWTAHHRFRLSSSPGNVQFMARLVPHVGKLSLLGSFLSVSLYFLHSVHSHTSEKVKNCLLLFIFTAPSSFT